MGMFSRTNDTEINLRLVRIERKLEAIIQHLQIELPSDQFDDIRALAQAGDTIAAIREYRTLTGCSLAEAKRAVESGL